MWTIFPGAFIIILHRVRTVYLFNLASLKLALFGSFSHWFTPGHFLRAGVIYNPLGLVTIMSPLASLLRCIYWSEPANHFLPPTTSFWVTVNFFSVNLFLFCNEVHLYPVLDSTRSDILWHLSFPVSLTSLSMITSGLFPVTGSVIISLFFISE